MITDTQNSASLQNTLHELINEYLMKLEGDKLTNFYEMYLEQIEPPLLEAVMQKTKYNQVRAAKMLGISRGTLRKKLKLYFDDKYCGERRE